MTLRSLLPTAFAAGLALLASARPAGGHSFAIGADVFLLDGRPFEIRCGEIHAARVPREYWAHRLRMAHAMGLNTVCAYLFGSMQEPAPGRLEWTGQGDIAAFCRAAQAEGPWAHAGANEVVVLDHLSHGVPTLAGLDKPILDELKPELDFAAPPSRPAVVTAFQP